MHPDEAGIAELSAILADGGVHIVCVADIASPSVKALLTTGAGLDQSERLLFLGRVNSDDATGCLWPIARLSALPARLAQDPLADIDSLRRCLKTVFDLNATLCKCPVLILYLCGIGAGAGGIAREAMQMHADLAGMSLVQELRILPAGISDDVALEHTLPG